MSKLVKSKVPSKLKVRFDAAFKGNKDIEGNVIHTWISNYVEIYEEDLSAKRLNEEADQLDKIIKTTAKN